MLENLERIVRDANKASVCAVQMSGANIAIEDVVRIARHGAKVEITKDETVLRRIRSTL
jgi:histidine ammonia-lyase